MPAVALTCGLVALLVASLALGSRQLGPEELWQGLMIPEASVPRAVVWELRVPRTVLAVTVGAALAAAGVLMQALTRNPLAEPGILGVNAGAALAVVVSISLVGARTVEQHLSAALLGAGLAAALVHLMARSSQDAGLTRLLLAGTAVGASLSSVTGTITMYDTKAFDSYRFWVVGSLEGRGTEVLAPLVPALAAGILLALVAARGLDALALGEEQARALGADLRRTRGTALVAITLLCGAATAAAGPLSFVGLIVPHTARLLVGTGTRRLLSWSLPSGAALLLGADVLGRVVARPAELEAGVVTAFLGAPVLVLAVMRRSA